MCNKRRNTQQDEREMLLKGQYQHNDVLSEEWDHLRAQLKPKQEQQMMLRNERKKQHGVITGHQILMLRHPPLTSTTAGRKAPFGGDC